MKLKLKNILVQHLQDYVTLKLEHSFGLLAIVTTLIIAQYCFLIKNVQIALRFIDRLRMWFPAVKLSLNVHFWHFSFDYWVLCLWRKFSLEFHQIGVLCAHKFQFSLFLDFEILFPSIPLRKSSFEFVLNHKWNFTLQIHFIALVFAWEYAT